MLKEKEFLVNEKNSVWYVGDITDNVVEIVKVKWDSEIQDFKFTCSACSKPNMTTLIIGDKIKYKQFDKNWHKINEKFLKNVIRTRKSTA